MSKLTISLVTYNSERYLDDFCRSLMEQTFQDFDIIVIDNDSYDRSAELAGHALPTARVVREKSNLGFARAHNLVIRWSRSPYVLVINPDIVMKKDCIEQLMAFMDEHAEAASCGPLLSYWDFERNARSDEIDSAGIELHGNYRASDRLQGTRSEVRLTQKVFGISGAFVLLRRTALEQVRIPQSGEHLFEYFDEDFFAYKEDVDLAWRLVIAGWENYLVPAARAYHHRSVSGRSAARSERRNRVAINRYSYRNHLLMIYKNHFWEVTAVRLHRIGFYELQKFFYLLFLDHSSVRGFRDFIRLMPRMRRKRTVIQSLRRVATRDFEEWLQ